MTEICFQVAHNTKRCLLSRSLARCIVKTQYGQSINELGASSYNTSLRLNQVHIIVIAHVDVDVEVDARI